MRFFLAEDFRPGLRQDRQTDTARIGFRHTFANGSDLISSVIYKNTAARSDHLRFTPSPSAVNFSSTSYRFELEHLFRSSALNLISGASYFSTTDRHLLVTSPLLPAPVRDETENISNASVYLYSHVHFPTNLTLMLGVSAEFFDGTFSEREQVNPKVGVTWQPLVGTTFRLALLRALSKEGIDIPQTIEPTDVAGCTQFFGTPLEQDLDNLDRQGIDEWHYCIGIDHKFFDGLYGGAEVSATDSDVPGVDFIFGTLPPAKVKFEDERNEISSRAYLDWTPQPWLAISAQYFFEKLDKGVLGPRTGIRELSTNRVPVEVSLFHPSGISASLRGTYIDQKGEFTLRPAPRLQPRDGEDRFWVIDATLQYRLPKRWGFIGFGVSNLLDEDFDFQPTDLSTPVVERDRVWFSRITLSF